MLRLVQKIKNTALVGLTAGTILAGSGCVLALDPSSKSEWHFPVDSNPRGASILLKKKLGEKVVWEGKTPCTISIKRYSPDAPLDSNEGDYVIHAYYLGACKKEEINYRISPYIAGDAVSLLGYAIDAANGNGKVYDERSFYFNFEEGTKESPKKEERKKEKLTFGRFKELILNLELRKKNGVISDKNYNEESERLSKQLMEDN